MRAVNLLPPDAYAPKQRLPYAPVVLAATAPVLAGALVYLGYSLEHAKVSDRQAALGLVQSQVDARKPSQSLVSESSRISGERASRESELSAALAKQVPWDVALDQVARVLPANAWLTSLTAASPTPAGSSAAAAASFTLQGYTYSETDVAHVLERLELLPNLTNVSLGSTSASQLGLKNVVQFTITASVTGASS